MGADGFGVRHPRAKGRVDAFSTTESDQINQSINQSQSLTSRENLRFQDTDKG